MQTFLPYADFSKSAACLDNKRLGKQRVEAMQILNILAGRTAAWKHHPAVLMWSGYEKALRQYLRAVVLEWKKAWISEHHSRSSKSDASARANSIGKRKFHSSHRSDLLRKDPQHYGRMSWEADCDLPCYWPVRIEDLR